MKNLMRKELLLAMHPASVLFLLLSAMLLIPNSPYSVICFYTCLGTGCTNSSAAACRYRRSDG